MWGEPIYPSGKPTARARDGCILEESDGSVRLAAPALDLVDSSATHTPRSRRLLEHLLAEQMVSNKPVQGLWQ